MAEMGFSPRKANACAVKAQGRVIKKNDANTPRPESKAELVSLKTQRVIREAHPSNIEDNKK